MYKYYNMNPKGNKVSDCAIRAISLATGKSWKRVYRELTENAINLGLMIDDVTSIEDYLDERYARVCHYSKTLEEFAYEFPYGTYVISMNGHLTCVIDGIIYDIFDPSKRIIRCSWRID